MWFVVEFASVHADQRHAGNRDIDENRHPDRYRHTTRYPDLLADSDADSEPDGTDIDADRNAGNRNCDPAFADAD